jgi:hypothetical protein
MLCAVVTCQASCQLEGQYEADTVSVTGHGPRINHRSLSALSFEARGSVVPHESNMLVPETIIIHVIGCTLRAEGLVGVLSDGLIYHGDGGKSS